MRKTVGLVSALLALIVSLAALSGCSSSTATSAVATNTRSIIDSAGRTVAIPQTVTAVYSAVPTAESMVYSLAPDKLIGWVNAPSDTAKPFLTEKARSLPVLGGWMGEKSTANLEEIIKANPDLIVFMTTIGINSNGAKLADTISQQTNRPVVVLDSSLAKTAEMYRLLGDWLGVAERGEELASYSEEALASVKSKVATIPDDKLVSVYYAESATGLATDPSGSDHTEVLDFVRGKNVASVEKKSGQGMSPVSMEQVLSWNPQVILVSTWSGGAESLKTIKTDATWAKVPAVSSGRVYLIPSQPFNWFDRPPNTARVLGVQWLANLLYPDAVKLDITKQVKEYYLTFYGATVTDAQVESLLSQGK